MVCSNSRVINRIRINYGLYTCSTSAALSLSFPATTDLDLCSTRLGAAMILVRGIEEAVRAITAAPRFESRPLTITRTDFCAQKSSVAPYFWYRVAASSRWLLVSDAPGFSSPSSFTPPSFSFSLSSSLSPSSSFFLTSSSSSFLSASSPPASSISSPF
ncbi:hypothetical protein GBAR_LOCUS31341 [Geodia barretti]|uniref:Uncharacterized protein n=1 Tax=Geodia barretti TaxID=519541 RepID=A0AA35XG20_GEOBA|nr:hypothetical protein GBAR_LOCUS31341 [Geodia barretti]